VDPASLALFQNVKMIEVEKRMKKLIVGFVYTQHEKNSKTSATEFEMRKIKYFINLNYLYSPPGIWLHWFELLPGPSQLPVFVC
jgi:hypothetical protein